MVTDIALEIRVSIYLDTIFHVWYNEANPPRIRPTTNPIGAIKKNLSIKFPIHPNSNKEAAI